MEDLYNRILQMGLDRGFKNMTEICAKSGVKRATMTEYKKGRTMGLSIDTLSKIAALYKTSVDDVMNGTKQGNLDREVRGFRQGIEWEKENMSFEDALQNLRDDERVLLEHYRSMTETDRDMMRDLARRLTHAD